MNDTLKRCSIIDHNSPSLTFHARVQIRQNINLALHLCLFDPLRTRTKTTRFPRELSSLNEIKVVVCSSEVTIVYKQKPVKKLTSDMRQFKVPT